MAEYFCKYGSKLTEEAFKMYKIKAKIPRKCHNHGVSHPEGKEGEIRNK